MHDTQHKSEKIAKINICMLCTQLTMFLLGCDTKLTEMLLTSKKSIELIKNLESYKNFSNKYFPLQVQLAGLLVAYFYFSKIHQTIEVAGKPVVTCNFQIEMRLFSLRRVFHYSCFNGFSILTFFHLHLSRQNVCAYFWKCDKAS